VCSCSRVQRFHSSFPPLPAVWTGTQQRKQSERRGLQGAVQILPPLNRQSFSQSVSSRSVSLDDSKRSGVQCAVQCSQCAYVQAVSVRGVSVCAMSVRAVSVCAVRVRACSEYARSVHPTVSAHAVNRSESSVLSVQRCCARAVSAVVRLCNGVCSHKCSAVSAVRAHSESVCIVSQCSA
jgi:hypothetical protein